MTGTIRLTTAQALVRWLVAQRSELLDGTEVPLFPGVFAIFGHGNVLGLGTALQEAREELPTWRAQNEQGMALAAIAYARATDRRQVMVATSSIGPGALNMVTAAGLAHANRLPVLLLPGDTFTSRAPDPVLQQVEHFGDPSTSANDSFRAVSRYLDRITRPEQLISTLPQVARVLTDPADCGTGRAWPSPRTLRWSSSTSRWRCSSRGCTASRGSVPTATTWRMRSRPSEMPHDRCWCSAVASATRAAAEALAFAETHGVPVVETVAGRTLVPHDHRLYGGALGIIGATSANNLAASADVVLAARHPVAGLHHVLMDRLRPDVRLVTVNAARFDAVKHSAQAGSATRGRPSWSCPPTSRSGRPTPTGPMSPPASWPRGTTTWTRFARAWLQTVR